MTKTTAQTIWLQVIEEMKEVLDPKIMKAHLLKSEVLEIKEKSWTIGVVSQYSADELAKKFKGNILGFLEEHVAELVDLRFVDRNDFDDEKVMVEGDGELPKISKQNPTQVPDQIPATKKKIVSEQTSQLPLQQMHEDVYADTTISIEELFVPRESGGPHNMTMQTSGSTYTGLNPHYIFENFIVGSSNRVAFAAAQGVADTPGKAYNPLFIYGGVGLGKTHLMQAVGNAIVAKFPNLRVQYFTSERFANDFIGSLRDKSIDKFRAKYRALDIILIDDIQFIAGKDSTQEEFFHTFNEIVGRGGHILMTSDRTPEEIGQLEERLVSRFKGGMMVDVGLPDYEMRVAIIRTKCQELRLTLPNDSIDFLATHIQSNTRELQGTFMSILSKVRSQGWGMELADIRRAWGEDVSAGPSLSSKNVTPSKVIQVVHHHFNIRKTDLLGKVRTKNFVVPRQICMYLLKHELGLPYESIGNELGGRDHTTIMHGVEQIQTLLSTNDGLRKEIMLIKQELLGQ